MKMMPLKLHGGRMARTVCPVPVGIIIMILAVHLSIGLIFMFEKNASHNFRLIPRYVDDTEFENPRKYLKRDFQDPASELSLRAEAVNSHLVAKRDILDKNSKSQNFQKDYLNIEGEASAFPFQCTSCAVVGNSGHLLNSKMGSIIDQSSCVFRLGLAPVKGYETDVGSKTTARVANSNRLYPFLKKPRKLISGPFASDQWFLFDRRRGDITHLYARLIPLIKKDKGIGFFWFSRKAELAVFEALRTDGQQFKMRMSGVHPEALLYTIRILEDAGCHSFEMFGIPDPKMCKRAENVGVRSKYWDTSSRNQCSGGTDASNVPENSKLSVEDVMSLSDRRGLFYWAKQRSNVTFHAPSWPVFLFS